MEIELYVRVRGRVLGPYDEGKLQSLARRGQLSRMHELSEDSIHWIPASTYPELFVSGEADIPVVEPDPEPAPRKGMADQPPTDAAQLDQAKTAAGSASPPQADQEWYYEKNGAEIGPVDYAMLQQMIAMGQLEPDTQVWTKGMAEWVVAGQVPGLVQPPMARTTGDNADGQSLHDTLPLSLCRAAISSHRWVQFIAIITFVFAGLSVVGGILTLIDGADKGDRPDIAIGLFTLIDAVLFAVAGFLLISHGRHLGSLNYSKSPIVLEKALDSLRVLWIYISMILVVMLALFVSLVVMFVAGGYPLRGL